MHGEPSLFLPLSFSLSWHIKKERERETLKGVCRSEKQADVSQETRVMTEEAREREMKETAREGRLILSRQHKLWKMCPMWLRLRLRER